MSTCEGCGFHMILKSLPRARKKWRSELTQSCLTLCDTMDCSLPASSIHGIFQAGILKWVAVSFSRGSSWPRDRTQVSHIAGRHFTFWATREAASGSIGSAWGQASNFCSVILLTLDWFLFTNVSFFFFSFLIYENVRVYWTCLWLERIIKGCTNYISCQINITLCSPADDLTSQSHLGCWKLYMYLSDCNSYDSWSVKSSHRSSGSIVPMFWMPWGTRFCFLFKTEMVCSGFRLPCSLLSCAGFL